MPVGVDVEMVELVARRARGRRPPAPGLGHRDLLARDDAGEERVVLRVAVQVREEGERVRPGGLEDRRDRGRVRGSSGPERHGARVPDRADPQPLVGVPADRGGRPRPARAQALRAARARRARAPRRHARRRAAGGGRGAPRRDRPPRARARVPEGRPGRVHRLGRPHERGHAGRGRRARRRLRPRALARLAGRRGGARARPPPAAAVARDGARDRVRAPPGLGREAPAVAHPRRRAADGARRRPRHHLLGLHALAGRRRLRRAADEDHRDPQRDRPVRPPAGRRPAAAAGEVRRAGREARAAGRAARLREGLPPRSGRAAGADPARGQGALPDRRARAPPRRSSRSRPRGSG